MGGRGARGGSFSPRSKGLSLKLCRLNQGEFRSWRDRDARAALKVRIFELLDAASNQRGGVEAQAVVASRARRRGIPRIQKERAFEQEAATMRRLSTAVPVGDRTRSSASLLIRVLSTRARGEDTDRSQQRVARFLRLPETWMLSTRKRTPRQRPLRPGPVAHACFARRSRSARAQ